MSAWETIDNPIASIVASFLVYLVAFWLAGGFLSHYLFVWMDYAATAAFSKTILCGIYALFAIVTLAIATFLRPNILEAAAIGALLGVAAGGVYACGYVILVIPVAVAAIVAVVCFFLKLGPIRMAYLGIGVGLVVSFVMFAFSAVTTAQVKTLTGVTSSSTTSVTNLTWGSMSASQRETFLAYVAATEASSLGIDNIAISECVLPEDVVATVDQSGRVLINYAAVRVESPSASKVQAYEANGDDLTWTYEALTSARHFVVPVCHAVGHTYQQLRVSGRLSESVNWPYEDASAEDGSNAVLDEWSASLPINPRTDVESFDTLLDKQAWNFGYARVGTYVKAK